MPVDQINGLHIQWERRGAGPRLLFCNGSGSTLDDMGVLFDALARSFEVLSWDYRGLGGSEPAGAPYALADVASDAAALLDLVRWERCRMFGISFGGMVAQEFAVTHPSRLERLALACTSAGGESGASYPLHELHELTDEERRSVGLTLSDSRWSEEWFATNPLDRALADRMSAREAARTPAARKAHLAQLASRRGHDVWDRLAAINCPTLVAYGRYDGIAPAENSAAIASRIAGADLRGYKGGHWFLAQDPAALPELIAFLASVQ